MLRPVRTAPRGRSAGRRPAAGVLRRHEAGHRRLHRELDLLLRGTARAPSAAMSALICGLGLAGQLLRRQLRCRTSAAPSRTATAGPSPAPGTAPPSDRSTACTCSLGLVDAGSSASSSAADLLELAVGRSSGRSGVLTAPASACQFHSLSSSSALQVLLDRLLHDASGCCGRPCPGRPASASSKSLPREVGGVELDAEPVAGELGEAGRRRSRRPGTGRRAAPICSSIISRISVLAVAGRRGSPGGSRRPASAARP